MSLSERGTLPPPSQEYRDNYDAIFRKTPMRRCPLCRGEGFIDGVGGMNGPVKCPVCKGTGGIPRDPSTSYFR